MQFGFVCSKYVGRCNQPASQSRACIPALEPVARRHGWTPELRSPFHYKGLGSARALAAHCYVKLHTMTRPSFVDSDYWALLGGKTPTPAPPATDVLALRASINAASQAASNALSLPDGMTTTVSTVPFIDGSVFNVTRFVPLVVQQSNEIAQRAVIYGFGGGLIAGGVRITLNMIAHFAGQTATQVFAPDYRLAPEHPYPAALHDINSTITWLQAHAVDFNVDPARIVMFGQSAGGNLMASVALKARDEGLTPPIAALVLRYPMLDDRTQMDPGDLRCPYLTWSSSSNALAWKAYLGKHNNPESTMNIPLAIISKSVSCINISKSTHPIYSRTGPRRRFAWTPADALGCRRAGSVSRRDHKLCYEAGIARRQSATQRLPWSSTWLRRESRFLSQS